MAPESTLSQEGWLFAPMPDVGLGTKVRGERQTEFGLSPADFRGVMLANEVVDAMPVHVVEMTRAGLRGSAVVECIVGADGRVYVTDRVVEPKQIERVHCFDAKTGKPYWKHDLLAAVWASPRSNLA